MDDREILRFKDEDGNDVELEVIETVKIEDSKYLIVAPIDDEENAYVYKLKEADGIIKYIAVEDENEFNKVLDEYNSLYEE